MDAKNNPLIKQENEMRSPKEIGWGNFGLRFLGAFGLYAVVSHIFSPFPSDLIIEPGSFKYYVMVDVLPYLMMFMFIFLIASIPTIIVCKVSRKHKKDSMPIILNRVLIATLIIGGLLIRGGWYANKKKEVSMTSKESSSVANVSDIKPVIAVMTIQSAQGVREEDLDLAGLKNLETWTVNTIIKKSKNRYVELGYDPNTFNPKMDVNSVYVTVSGKKLAVIKINTNSARFVTIIGIKGEELHRVACVRESNHDIPIWYGECGNKIKEVFGVNMKP